MKQLSRFIANSIMFRCFRTHKLEKKPPIKHQLTRCFPPPNMMLPCNNDLVHSHSEIYFSVQSSHFLGYSLLQRPHYNAPIIMPPSQHPLPYPHRGGVLRWRSGTSLASRHLFASRKNMSELSSSRCAVIHKRSPVEETCRRETLLFPQDIEINMPLRVFYS